MRLISFFIILTAVLTAPGARGEELRLSLDECIARARSLSVNAVVARNELRTSYWEYRSYKADRLPEVTFNASEPS